MIAKGTCDQYPPSEAQAAKFGDAIAHHLTFLQEVSMSHIGLADLLGVRTKAIDWERPLLFFGALFCSGLVWQVVYPLFQWLSGDSYSFQVIPASRWLDWMLGNLLLALLAPLALRGIPVMVLASLATALSYGLLSRLIFWAVVVQPIKNILSDGNRGLLPEFIFLALIADATSSGAESFFRNWEYWEPRAILTVVLWPLFLLGALGMTVRRIKPLWLAILVGAWVSELALMVAMTIIYNYPNLELKDFTNQIGLLPFRLLDATIFALVLWGGLRLTTGQDLTAERKERRLTKGFYLIATLALIGASLILLATVMVSTTFGGPWPRSYMDQAFVSILFACLIGLFGEIVFLILTYRMWKAIQDGHARTTPSGAVGLLLVPFFNLYWIFQAYRGFAKDFNSFVSRHSINTPLLPTSLFTAYGALMICSVIPFIRWPLIVVNFFVMLVMISKICDAVNSIPEKLPDQEVGGPAFQAP